jgi:multiple sugar transport system permease protein
MQRLEPVPSEQVTAQPGSRSPAGRRAGFRPRSDRHFYVLAALPAFILVFLVTIVPLAAAFGLSFTSYTAANPIISWAGVRNYRLLFSDPSVPTVLVTTALFAAAAVILETVAGTVLALLMARKMRGVSVYRVLYLIPLMVAGIASAVAWKALLNTSAGWVNAILGVFGVPEVNWLASPHVALPAIIIADIWSGAPVVAVLVLAGLLAMSDEPLEAARIDGAGQLQVLRYITLPAIRPVLGFAVIFRTVDVFRQFGLIQIMTGGGPGQKTTMLNFYIYQNVFMYGNISYGSTLAVLLIVAMAIPLGIIYFIANRRR